MDDADRLFFFGMIAVLLFAIIMILSGPSKSSHSASEWEKEQIEIQRGVCEKMGGVFEERDIYSAICAVQNQDGLWSKHGMDNVGGKWVVLE